MQIHDLVYCNILCCREKYFQNKTKSDMPQAIFIVVNSSHSPRTSDVISCSWCDKCLQIHVAIKMTQPRSQGCQRSQFEDFYTHDLATVRSHKLEGLLSPVRRPALELEGPQFVERWQISGRDTLKCGLLQGWWLTT